VVGQHLVRQHVVGEHLVRQYLVGEHLVREHLVGQHVVRRELGRPGRERPAVNAAEAARRDRRARVALAALIAVTATAGVLLFLLVVRHLEPYSASVRVPWWILAAGFAVAELCAVHAHVRGSAHSLSLSELPLIVGLLLARPQDVVVAQVIGAVIVLTVRRGHSPVKLAFNVSQFVLTSSLALVVIHTLAPGTTATGPQLWGATFAAVAAASALGAALVYGAIGLAEGAVPSAKPHTMIGAALIVALTNTSVGLAGASIVAEDVRSGWLLLPPAGILLLAYRAYLSERTKHQSLEFLYAVARSVSRAPNLEAGLLNLLGRCRETFRVRTAEVVLFATGGDIPLMTAVREGAQELMKPLEPSLATALRDCVHDDRAVLVERRHSTGELRRYLELRGIEQALVAPVPGERRLTGVMLIADRLGVTASFSRNDLRLFETLAEHAGMSFEFDRLEQAIGRMQELQARLEEQAFRDPLTALPNRALFVSRLEESLARDRGTVTVLFVDLDDFKAINDEGGHAAGDAVLVALAERMRACVRPDDLAARLGGDEFALLLEDVDDVHGEQVAARILEGLVDVVAEGRRISVGSSVGIASAAVGSASPDELMKQADVAMYRAKQAGKGHVRVWTPEMRDSGLAAAPRAADIRRALAAGEIEPHLQPITDLRSGRIVAVEALARWRHPRHGLLGPSDFVPAAEATGLVGMLDRAMLAQACRAAAAIGAPSVHVNVSGAGLRTRELVDAVERALDESGLAPERLVLELTESVLAAEQPLALEVLRELRSRGVRVALDDFGTGYSSLAALRELPVDVLKVPKPFVDGRGSVRHDRALLTMLIQLGRLFGLQVVAEGIERPDQVDLLRELGCELGQGYLLGRPMSVDALAERLRPACGTATVSGPGSRIAPPPAPVRAPVLLA
jgi:diguanylate cyclase (GGDEF)-like protein